MVNSILCAPQSIGFGRQRVQKIFLGFSLKIMEQAGGALSHFPEDHLIFHKVNFHRYPLLLPSIKGLKRNRLTLLVTGCKTRGSAKKKCSKFSRMILLRLVPMPLPPPTTTESNFLVEILFKNGNWISSALKTHSLAIRSASNRSFSKRKI